MKQMFFIVIATMVMNTVCIAENLCSDKTSWKEWESLVKKYNNDMDVQMLHALRIGLCEKIEAGTISFEDAERLFDKYHQKIYLKAKEEQKKREVPRAWDVPVG